MPTREQRDPLLRGTTRLLRFESRLALSASAAADVLLDLWDFETQTGGSGSDVGDAGYESLLAQAGGIHQRFGFDGSGQTVVVIDSGIAYDHIALGVGYGPGYRVVGGWDFAENDANPYDDGPAGFHGTHVAGLLGGSTDGFAGMAPGADLIALRVFDDFGNANLDWVEDALSWVYDNRSAFENPITTVNLSLGAALPAELADQVYAQLEDELSLLKSEGIMVFAAAGNAFDASQPDQLAYPASSPHVTPVGSVAAGGMFSHFSQRTDGILAAPGEMVYSSVPDHVLGRDGRIDDFVNATGTSMAVPQVAGAAMLVREAMQSAGLQADSTTVISHLFETADQRTDTVTGLTYHQINLTRAIEQLIAGGDDSGQGNGDDGGLPPVEPEVDEPIDPAQPAIDLGSISHTGADLESGRWYSVDASRDGLLSIALSGESGGAAAIAFEDAEGNPITQLSSAAEGQVDVQVTAGQTVRFRIESGEAETVAVEMANLVSLADGTARYTGTSSADQIAVDLRTDTMLRFGQFEYQFGDGTVTKLQIVGGGGNDSVEVLGSQAAEKVTLRPGSGLIENSKITVELVGIAGMRVDGGGGADRAYLYDSPGNDTLSAGPGEAVLSGVGFNHQVTSINSIYVHATAGGTDVAYLYDSPGDDRLVIRPSFTSLRGEGYFNLVYGFGRVNAYGTAGGHDTAELYDSPGDDRMSANRTQAFISGPGYYGQARHFESVVGHSTAGGTDHATIYADSADQKLHRTGGLVQLDAGNGTIRAARGFEISETFLGGTPIVVAPQAIGSNAAVEPLDQTEREGMMTLQEDRGDLWVAKRIGEIMGTAQSLVQGPSNDDDHDRELLDQLFAEL